MSSVSVKPAFSLNPLMWLATSFAFGIILGRTFDIPFSITIAAIVVLSVAAAVLRGHWVSTGIILFLFALAGAMCMRVETASVSPDRLKRIYDEDVVTSGDPVEIEGVLFGEPEPAPEGYFLEIEASEIRFMDQSHSASGRARLFLPIATDETRADLDDLGLRHGSRLRVACRLEREDRFLNPGVMMRTQMLDRQGIDATGTVKSPLLIENIGSEPVFIPLAFAFELRIRAIERFRETFSQTAAGILIASTFGNKYFLDKRTADVFREGGTFHVLVISGLHITFIGGLILLMLRAFTSNRRIQAAIAIGCLWLYGIAVGGDAPVIRACVMFTVLMIGYASYRTSSLLNLLGVCILALLVWQPSDLFDPSFQLTIVSVAAIVAFGVPLLAKLKAIGSWTPSSDTPFPPNVSSWVRRVCESIYWNETAWNIERKQQIWSASIKKTPFFKRTDDHGLRRTVTFIFEGIVISAVVMVCMLPLLVYYFHRVSLVSIPLNLWVGSVLAVESIFAMIAVLIGSVSSVLAVPFVACVEILNWILVEVSAVFSESRWGSIRVPIYSGLMRAIYLIYFVPVVAVCVSVFRWDAFRLGSITRRAKYAAVVPVVVLAVFAAIIVLHPFSAPRPDGRLHVEFLDVGQGDAAFITFPNGSTMLVDAGGRMNYGQAEDETFQPDIPRIGEAVVSEFLWEKGISSIDYIVATHADTDHIQGLVDVANNFAIGTAFFGRFDGDDPDLVALISVLDHNGVPKILVTAGETIEIDGVWIDVLNPFENTAPMSANNDSIVLKLIFGDVSFLLTGDIEREAESRILVSSSGVNSTIIKVPHHGSRSSSTQPFVDAVDAQYAVISVGKRSVFGHPHSEVVERWKAAGANVMTTGENGTITFSTDGESFDTQIFLIKH